MKKMVFATILTAAVFASCGDRDRIYKEQPDKGDITIIGGGLGGQSCVCTNNNCQCQPQIGNCQNNQCQGQNQGQGQNQNQNQGQAQNQSGQPVTITINNASSATNKNDISNCQRSYVFNEDKTFNRNVTCQNGYSCKGKGTWVPTQPIPVPPLPPFPPQQQQQQQQSPYNLEYSENSCGDCQSELIRI